MKFSWLEFRNMRRVLGVCFLSTTMLVACAKPTVPLSIHGVNYSAEAFTYVVVDPNDAKNTGGGELIDPYAAGGTNCCYELPKKWRAGIKVTINSNHWLGKLDDGSLREVASTQSVEVPRYADGKPGELWVLRAADGTMDLVSSDFQPDHPKWPGKVKGWPVPSLVYQRERWDLYVNHEKGGVKLYENMLAELNATPDIRAKEAWNFFLKYDKKDLAGYSGPENVDFRNMLRRRYEEGLRRSREQLRKLELGRP